MFTPISTSSTSGFSSIDPGYSSATSAWATHGITNSSGAIDTVIDNKNQKYAVSNTNGTSSFVGLNGTNVPAQDFGFKTTPFPLEANKVYSFPEIDTKYNNSGSFDTIAEFASKGGAGKVDKAGFGTAATASKVEITREYTLDRFGLPKKGNDQIAQNDIARYNQLEYGVTPSTNLLQSLVMPPVRIQAINKPRDLVTLTVTPQMTLQGTANYTSYDVAHLPTELFSYKNTSAKSITLTTKLISRTVYEASINQERLAILEAWTKPYFGTGTAKSYGAYLGAPPAILKLWAYGQRYFNGMPCVLTNYTADWRDDVGIVFTEKGQAIPAILPITITLQEHWSPEEIGSFNIADMFLGNMVKAYTGKVKG